MNTKIAMAAVVACATMMAGCATIIQSPQQDVGFASNPSNAKVSINGKHIGDTPLTTKLPRKDHHIVRIDLPGYMPYETTLTRSVSGWVWGNVVFGGLIGLAVDAMSGGMYKLTPDQVSAEMRSGTANVTTDGDGLYIVVVLEPKAEWEQVAMLAPAR